jgi:hypothetical protein
MTPPPMTTIRVIIRCGQAAAPWTAAHCGNTNFCCE